MEDFKIKGTEFIRQRQGELEQLFGEPTHALDAKFAKAHDEVFSRIDCLTCANCCKTTGPLFTYPDMIRIAKGLEMPVQKFIDDYLQIDEDGDHILQALPCPFLMEDNKCRIYAFRPEACASYPHTNEAGMNKIFDLTLKNAEICPAVVEILSLITPK